MIPAIIWVVPRYGANGAAWIWVGLNTFYLFVTAHLMYRFILRNEKWTWLFHDLFVPLLLSTIGGLIVDNLVPNGETLACHLFHIAATATATVSIAAIAAPFVRSKLYYYIRRNINISRIGVGSIK